MDQYDHAGQMKLLQLFSYVGLFVRVVIGAGPGRAERPAGGQAQ